MPHRKRETLVKMIGWLVGAYGVVAGTAWAAQRALMYPAPKRGAEPTVANGALLKAPSMEGRTAWGFHVPAPAGAPTVVFFHGNGEELADTAWLAEELVRRDLGVLAAEYPGYGLAAEYPTTEETIGADAFALLDHAIRQGIPPSKQVLMGHSLGAAVAVEMARRGQGARLVLVSPFTSMTDMVKKVAPFLPATLIVKDRWESLAKAESIGIPAMVVHGENDALIPCAMGRALAAALRTTARVVPQAGHNDVFALGGEDLMDDIARFARGEADP